MTSLVVLQHAEQLRQMHAMCAGHAERIRQIQEYAAVHAERVRSLYAMAARQAAEFRQIGEYLAEQSRRLAAIVAARAQRRPTHESYALPLTSPRLAQPPPRLERIVIHVIPAEPRPNRRIGFASWDCPDRR